MITLKLKIKDKGLMVEIPGLPPTRTPADIDISKLDLNLVITNLRKHGINNYKIVSVIGDGIEKTIVAPQVVKRFKKLEDMMIEL